MTTENTKGFEKIVTVYIVTNEVNKAVAFPTKAQAKFAQKLLQSFGVNSEMRTEKKKISI